MNQQLKAEVEKLLDKDNTGHGVEHVQRVSELALKLAESEVQADKKVVELAAWLHDVDDYKLFGEENATNLTNARKIMEKLKVNNNTANKVCDIIANMGYSKSLQGIRPKTTEGKIVSDADMLDAIGAMGTIRCLSYAWARCETPIFNPDVFPEINLSAKEYKKANRKSDNFINHYFEKLLKLKNMMMTQAGKKEAEVRHKFMVNFLDEFFREQNLSVWQKYLHDFLEKH